MIKFGKEIQLKLTKNLLDTIILDILRKEDMHGYQLITEIRKGFGIRFGPSTIYPLLGVLEKKGYVASSWNMNFERPRKVYKLTDDGKNVLNYSENSLMMMCKSLTGENKALTASPMITP